MFIIGVYPYNDIYKQWHFKSASKIIEKSPLEHLTKICNKNIHYLCKLQIHIKKAPHIFATWCHSLLKLFLNTNNPLPRNTMINNNDAFINDNIYNDFDEEKDNQSKEFEEIESIINYLENREIHSASLLYGLNSKNISKSVDISLIYFGLHELNNIYPSQSIHIESIFQWLSLCLTEAIKTCNQWHQTSINSLHKILIQLSNIDLIYRKRIEHIKHCLFSTKIHYFSLHTEISFHKAIPIPNIIFNDSGIIEQKNKIIFDFFCNSIPSFLDCILLSLNKLSKLPKAIPILLQRFVNIISSEMRDHSPNSNTDHGMLRGIHHIICCAMYYILNQPLWILDSKLNQSLEILNNYKLNPLKDLGLNKNIKITNKEWKYIGKQLHLLEYHITPSTKMQCIHQIIQTLTHQLHAHLIWLKTCKNNKIKFQNNQNKNIIRSVSDDINVGADDIFPSLIWLIIQTQPKRLSSSLSLIEHIMHESPNSGIHAYSFTLFKQAISYIQQLANDKSSPNK
eukprot:100990_1